MRKVFTESNVKVSLAFMFSTLALLSLLAYVLDIALRKELEAETYKKMEASGNTVVAELTKHTTLVSTLAENLASAATHLTYSDEAYHAVLPQLMSPKNFSEMIAGGGIWPEPNALVSGVERKSYFWGRADNGELNFFDGYNTPEGNGYHNEEWYVPARFLKPGSCYWSRSYVDPYSKEPMVTCTKTLHKDGQYIGATTIDMKLDGFNAFFKAESRKIGGYIFLVDQNNKFISYPDQSKIQRSDGTGNIYIDDLAAGFSAFSPFASRLKALSAKAQQTDEESQPQREKMAAYFANNSYQVNTEQADVMAAALLNPLETRGLASYLLGNFRLSNDLIHQAPVNVSVFHVPEAYWKLVVVTPQDQDFAFVSQVISETSIRLILPLLVVLSLCYWFIQRSFIKPLNRFTQHLKRTGTAPEQQELITSVEGGDFGKLAKAYNDKILQIRRVMAQLNTYASFDMLTNLYNRRAFDNRLDAIIESKQHANYAICYIDLDQFKVVNDTAGHMAGDELLKLVAKKLAYCVRDEDVLARIGGDEFALLMLAESGENAVETAENLCANVSSIEFHWEKSLFSVSCSIGVLHLQTTGPDKQKILSAADTACYTAKDAGRNRVHLYLPEDDQISRRSGDFEKLLSLTHAIDERRLFLEYQLIENVRGNSYRGVEALLRLKDERGNTVFPGDFMQAAERYGSTWEIDNWVIKTAIAEFAAAVDQIDIGFCTINITAQALNNRHLISTVESALKQNTVNGEMYCFEVTETAAVNNIDQAIEQLSNLKALGCKVALDDFGSGMASYGYLKELPIDYLKIDGAFVKNISTNKVDAALVKSINEVAQVMGIETIAEWVEDEQTLRLLKRFGVNYAQGYALQVPQALLANVEALEA